MSNVAQTLLAPTTPVISMEPVVSNPYAGMTPAEINKKKATEKFDISMRDSRRFRRIVGMVNKGQECYQKHGDPAHGFINQMEEDISKIATPEDIDILVGTENMHPRRDGSPRNYLDLSSIEVTG